MNNKRKNKDKKNKNKKKMKTWKKVLIVILLIILVFIGYFTYRTYKNGWGLSGFLATAVGHNENTKKELGEIQFLILGVSTDIEAELTDTIMVASYNPNTQQANLLSIPRDTFVGSNKTKATASQKINALYAMNNNNPEKTLEAVNDITGLNLKNYVIVKTEALVKLVDAIGGVEFYVPMDMVYDDDTQDLHINLKEGTQVLDGDKAEQLLRFRHSNADKKGNMTTYSSEYGSDDYGRMRTQREFITAVLQQTLKPSNIFKIGQLLDIANEYVETNMSFSYIKDYVPYAVEFSTDNLQTAAIPGESEKLNEIWFFVCDETQTGELIQAMFFNDIEEENEKEPENTISSNVANTASNTTSSSTSKASQIKVELINGSGNSDKLKEATTKLEEAGCKVTKTGTTSAISKTIITNKKQLSDEKISEIKQALGGIGVISTKTSSNSTIDVSIILGQDFE